MTNGGWYGLLGIVREAQQLRREDEQRQPVECPNDGEPLLAGPDGRPYCPFDGWRPDR